MDSAPSLPRISTSFFLADAPRLPRPLTRLVDLAYNLWWTWTPAASELFASIDADRWQRHRNPVALLHDVPTARWSALAEDESFRARLDDLVRALDAYLGPDAQTWFGAQARRGAVGEGAMAYVSMEYGLHESLPIYSGGLGILSGDHCKSASDLGLPMIAVGLLYRSGYFLQTVDREGRQQHVYPRNDFDRLPLRRLLDPVGAPLRLTLPMPGRTLVVQPWVVQVGRVPLVLLDTDLPENDAADRPITNLLYVQGREMRLVQELVLGFGAEALIHALEIEPEVWHLNEGHVAFVQLARLRRRAAETGLPAAEARLAVCDDTVFTTHTPVPAGNEQFEPQLVTKYLASWCEEVGMSEEALLDLGRSDTSGDMFNLTALGLRTSRVANGVSQLNAEVTSDMWRGLFPPETAQPIRGITNGVHAPTWLGREVQALYRRALGDGWGDRLRRAPEEALAAISDEALWQAHRAQKARLGRLVSARTRDQVARAGGAPDDLRAADGLFDDQALTIGFARRFATYKRATLLFADFERLVSLLADGRRPIQVLFAGKAHPADQPGQDLLQAIFRHMHDPRLRGRVFLLENYDMQLGRAMVQGVDVWLNTPRKPLEASGTSGMKVAMNGGLNLSILDGWWPEAYDGENGWAIDGGTRVTEAEQDEADARSLYSVLGDSVLPAFYDQQGPDGLPREWVARMRRAMVTLTDAFSSDRMVRDYVEKLYAPTAVTA